MWFSNLIFYSLDKPFSYTAEHLEEALAEAMFEPCGKRDMNSLGWTSPMGTLSPMLVHAGSGAMMICAKKEERILPPSVIRDFLNDRVNAIEEAELRKVYKKEKDRLRDEIVLDLIPRAFTRSSCTWALILPAQQLLILNASSARKADEFIALLHETLDDIHLHLPQTRQAPADVLTLWLSAAAQAPADLEIGDECELQEPGEEGGVIRCRRQDLAGDEIQVHLQAGKRVMKLGVHWDEKLSCLLCDDLAIKKLKFSDAVLEDAADQGADDAAARFDADFTLMALELGRFVPRLIELFGGAAEPR